MICDVCSNYTGDSEDNLIRYILGHYPVCPDFKIDKSLFLSEFKRQVDFQVSRTIISTLPILEDTSERLPILGEQRESSRLIKRLYQYLSIHYFPIVSNSYIFNWESDLLAINKDSSYITEYEIKISRGDFKADFKKIDKHQLIKDSHEYNFSSYIPNYLYYATPPGLLDKSEIPKYAGLLEIGVGIRIVKRAPLLHKEIINDKMVDNLLKKVYTKYWSK